MKNRCVRARHALLAWCVLPAAAHAAAFDFVALGDTAYDVPADHPAYAALIERINRTQPAFTIHVGDTWGAAACQEEDHREILGWFARFEQPLIYTPGDNEWTDCVDPQVQAAFERLEDRKPQPGDERLVADFRRLDRRAERSGQWALASLERIRRTFFDTPLSLGQRTRSLTRQAAVSQAHRQMVENARWSEGEVVFATVHVVGSMNGLSIASAESATEAVRRNQANVAWLQQTFDEAARSGAKAVVIAMHAAIFEKTPPPGSEAGAAVRGGRSGPYGLIALALRELGTAFGRPVLLIHGDDHEFTVDRPFLGRSADGSKTTDANILRLQVFGAPELRAVRIGVDTSTPGVFSFAPL